MQKVIGVVGAAFAALGVVAFELAAVIAVFVYLLDKGWGIIPAGVLTISIIGAILTSLYAAFVDGYWLPLLLSAGGIIVGMIGGLFLELAGNE